MLTRFRQLFIASCIIFLTACGGGSDHSNPPQSDPVPASSSSLSSVASSTISSASSSIAATIAAPQNVSAKGGNNSITITWNAVAGATGYHVFYATEANIQSKNISAYPNGTWVQNVTSPYVATALENNKTYYVVVTAVNGTIESTQSIEVSATPSADDALKQPNAQEVLVIELINRARFDPTAEAARYGIGLNDGITGPQITTDRKPPLAPNALLVDAARVHSQWMLDNNTFTHEGANGNSPTDRMRTAGYIFAGSWSNGENIAWAGTTATRIDLTEYAINHHEGLFKSPGHRLNIFGSTFREVGTGQKQGNFLYNGTTYLSSMLTEDFARSGSNYFLTGVIYNDVNSNQFYDVGEGLDGITINTNGKSYPVAATGSYAIPLGNGNYTVTVTGAALTAPIIRSIQINNANIKLDVIKNTTSVNVVTW